MALTFLLAVAAAANIVVNSGSSVANQKTSTTHASPVRRAAFGMSFGGTLQYLSSSELASELADVAHLGFTWIRFDIQWETVQADGPNGYDWSAYDGIVDTASRYKLHVLPTLAYAPQWARLANCDSTDKCAPADPAQFASFAQAAVLHFKPQGVHDWEIWNEPNLMGFWRPAPDPRAYAALLKAVYPAIRSVEPQATVISGGLGVMDQFSQSIAAPAFLADVYKYGAGPYFNAVGYHPYSFPALPDQTAGWSGWSMIDNTQDSLRNIMITNGDSKKLLWLTEYGAPTNGPGAEATQKGYNTNTSPDHVDEALQAIMAQQAVAYVRSSSWLGPLFWYTYKDSGADPSTNEKFFGLLQSDGSKKPAYYTFEQILR